ncbi:FKBP-type peptidyl-prolyl cis-trans isomerase [Aurantibacillus circumpalustris]|uniref:FKBP-type peptidyl-prolyl cis-trans isomerase n=1 Tax=Aurantibacillus circumpalustris TaxID=3036359 RepID=UPI00295AE826|nr:FKBP-type peptidyl-prolyl cis-trans isomerase [Aurantibacillus circumpalustris]
MKKFLSVLVFILSFVACKKEKTVDQVAVDEEIITKYISNNKLNATATGSGLYYVIQTQGSGVQPTVNSTVKVNYKGYLTDGSVFDYSKSGGYSTLLTQVIQGWQEGIPYFKKGGKGILLIPSRLGYGAQGAGTIPPNSVLIFDIELLDVN